MDVEVVSERYKRRAATNINDKRTQESRRENTVILEYSALIDRFYAASARTKPPTSIPRPALTCDAAPDLSAAVVAAAAAGRPDVEEVEAEELELLEEEEEEEEVLATADTAAPETEDATDLAALATEDAAEDALEPTATATEDAEETIELAAEPPEAAAELEPEVEAELQVVLVPA
ncbi:MAG: hypothetical protein CYPHOPRED_003735 [Cyphobasidiales sp. Tagirdzhanova-0007]|nr:MAG: hypothetical protein CYPHOPRED_003735 [Cyphobasidiales sp. Tagirdzhanova-0007]